MTKPRGSASATSNRRNDGRQAPAPARSVPRRKSRRDVLISESADSVWMRAIAYLLRTLERYFKSRARYPVTRYRAPRRGSSLRDLRSHLLEGLLHVIPGVLHLRLRFLPLGLIRAAK